MNLKETLKIGLNVMELNERGKKNMNKNNKNFSIINKAC